MNAATPLELHRLPVAQLRAELAQPARAAYPDSRVTPRIGHYTGLMKITG